jgi:hypothetical protein
MPGAPPYPATPPPAPPAPPGPDPGLSRSFAAAAAWALVNFALLFAIAWPPPAATEIGIVLLTLVAPTVLTAFALRFVASGRGWRFWLLLIVALPLFVMLRALQAYFLI